jgi:hypothetical protein
VIGFSFGSSNVSNFIQNCNLFLPQSFTYPYSPYIDITTNQSIYSNKQLLIEPVQNLNTIMSSENLNNFYSSSSRKKTEKRIRKYINNL